MDAPTLLALRQKIEQAITPLLPENCARICIIDPPGHPNVGDNAILLGELDFIARHFPKAELSFYDVDSYTPGADCFIEKADVLLIHGGGNFGDIWPHHHRLRMRILDRFPHKPVLQMPQSIHFDADRELQATAAVIGRHRNFTLTVRDGRSFDYARRHFDCNVVLSPDMAFAMRPIPRGRLAVDCLCLMRTDKEALTSRDDVQDLLAKTDRSFEMVDWLDDPRGPTAQLDKRLKWLTSKLPAAVAPFRSGVMLLRHRYASQRVAFGVALLSRGGMVITDRLHAHILCCLLGIPHQFFDSYDGKISAFHSTWTGTIENAQQISSLAQLAARLPPAARRVA